MTSPINTNAKIFSSPKANLTQTENFIAKVTGDTYIKDSRESGFKKVFNESKNNVHMEFEAPAVQELSANIRPGQKNKLWINA